MTKLAGVIGWPVSHSLSPAMMNAAFKHCGLDWNYLRMPVSTEHSSHLENTIANLHYHHFRGANVTVPYKEAVMPLLDRLSERANNIGAVNTILVKGDKTLFGDNTDAPGFISDLRIHNIVPEQTQATVLGAGGSARAIVYGLLEAGCTSLNIINRSKERAQQIIDDMKILFADAVITNNKPSRAGLIVNCTSLGLNESDALPWDPSISFNQQQIVYDLIYNPPKTALFKKAEADGARAISGLGMLVHQGALAFEMWTGEKAPIEIMKSAAEEALNV